MDRLTAFFEGEFADGDDSGFFFSDDEDQAVAKAKNFKVQRDLAEGQNLNNSFGCYSPEDWEHLHVDKGANPQFKVLQHGTGGVNPAQAKPKVQIPTPAAGN